MKPEKGWVMYYYPDKYQSYGGYNYTVKFDAESAEVGFELSEDLSDTVTSLYRLGNDTGQPSHSTRTTISCITSPRRPQLITRLLAETLSSCSLKSVTLA